MDVQYLGPAPPYDYKKILGDAASKYGLDQKMFYNLVKTESGFDRSAVNPKSGASGLMQFMPKTAAALGVKNPYDPYEAADAGAKYLSSLIKKHQGNTDAALAEYGGFVHNDPSTYINKVEGHTTNEQSQPQETQQPKMDIKYLGPPPQQPEATEPTDVPAGPKPEDDPSFFSRDWWKKYGIEDIKGAAPYYAAMALPYGAAAAGLISAPAAATASGVASLGLLGYNSAKGFAKAFIPLDLKKPFLPQALKEGDALAKEAGRQVKGFWDFSKMVPEDIWSLLHGEKPEYLYKEPFSEALSALGLYHLTNQALGHYDAWRNNTPLTEADKFREELMKAGNTPPSDKSQADLADSSNTAPTATRTREAEVFPSGNDQPGKAATRPGLEPNIQEFTPEQQEIANQAQLDVADAMKKKWQVLGTHPDFPTTTIERTGSVESQPWTTSADPPNIEKLKPLARWDTMRESVKDLTRNQLYKMQDKGASYKELNDYTTRKFGVPVSKVIPISPENTSDLTSDIPALRASKITGKPTDELTPQDIMEHGTRTAEISDKLLDEMLGNKTQDTDIASDEIPKSEVADKLIPSQRTDLENLLLGYNAKGEPVYQWQMNEAQISALKGLPFDKEAITVVRPADTDIKVNTDIPATEPIVRSGAEHTKENHPVRSDAEQTNDSLANVLKGFEDGEEITRSSDGRWKWGNKYASKDISDTLDKMISEKHIIFDKFNGSYVLSPKGEVTYGLEEKSYPSEKKIESPIVEEDIPPQISKAVRRLSETSGQSWRAVKRVGEWVFEPLKNERGSTTLIPELAEKLKSIKDTLFDRDTDFLAILHKFISRSDKDETYRSSPKSIYYQIENSFLREMAGARANGIAMARRLSEDLVRNIPEDQRVLIAPYIEGGRGATPDIMRRVAALPESTKQYFEMWRQFSNDMLEELQRRGKLDKGIENYITHIVLADDKGNVLAPFNPKMARTSPFRTLLELAQEGKKVDLDIASIFPRTMMWFQDWKARMDYVDKLKHVMYTDHKPVLRPRSLIDPEQLSNHEFIRIPTDESIRGLQSPLEYGDDALTEEMKKLKGDDWYIQRDMFNGFQNMLYNPESQFFKALAKWQNVVRQWKMYNPLVHPFNEIGRVFGALGFKDGVKLLLGRVPEELKTEESLRNTIEEAALAGLRLTDTYGWKKSFIEDDLGPIITTRDYNIQHLIDDPMEFLKHPVKSIVELNHYLVFDRCVKSAQLMIYVAEKNRLIDRYGLDPKNAARIAAEQANTFAGTLQPFSFGKEQRRWLRSILYARDWGVSAGKAMAATLPKETQYGLPKFFRTEVGTGAEQFEQMREGDFLYPEKIPKDQILPGGLTAKEWRAVNMNSRGFVVRMIIGAITSAQILQWAFEHHNNHALTWIGQNEKGHRLDINLGTQDRDKREQYLGQFCFRQVDDVVKAFSDLPGSFIKRSKYKAESIESTVIDIFANSDWKHQPIWGRENGFTGMESLGNIAKQFLELFPYQDFDFADKTKTAIEKAAPFFGNRVTHGFPGYEENPQVVQFLQDLIFAQKHRERISKEQIYALKHMNNEDRANKIADLIATGMISIGQLKGLIKGMANPILYSLMRFRAQEMAILIQQMPKAKQEKYMRMLGQHASSEKPTDRVPKKTYGGVQ
jgi:hypothetical protein